MLLSTQFKSSEPDLTSHILLLPLQYIHKLQVFLKTSTATNFLQGVASLLSELVNSSLFFLYLPFLHFRLLSDYREILCRLRVRSQSTILLKTLRWLPISLTVKAKVKSDAWALAWIGPTIFLTSPPNLYHSLCSRHSGLFTDAWTHQDAVAMILFSNCSPACNSISPDPHCSLPHLLQVFV